MQTRTALKPDEWQIFTRVCLQLILHVAMVWWRQDFRCWREDALTLNSGVHKSIFDSNKLEVCSEEGVLEGGTIPTSQLVIQEYVFCGVSLR